MLQAFLKTTKAMNVQDKLSQLIPYPLGVSMSSSLPPSAMPDRKVLLLYENRPKRIHQA